MPIWHPDCAAASVRWYYYCNKGGRVIDRYCGRCWCTCKCSTRKNICGYDFDPHFRRSLGLVWSYRITHSHVPMIVKLIKYHLNQSIKILSKPENPPSILRLRKIMNILIHLFVFYSFLSQINQIV